MYINIAFCFDHNLTRQAQAAVASLLDSSDLTQTHYHIYCICTGKAAHIEPNLRRIIEARDCDSVLTMKAADSPYQDAYEVRGISSGAYLRLMLPKLLPDVDKILYTDIDVLFRDDLAKLWQTDIEGCVLAAVKGMVNCSDKWEWNSDRPYWHHLENMKGRYINSGVLLLNLAEVRRRDLEKEWLKWAEEKLYYQDQDILNLTCQDSIRYLPLKYNRFAYVTENDLDMLVSEGIFAEEEYKEALEHPVIIHYAGDKPWKQYDTNLGYLWWDYVKSHSEFDGMFDERAARRYHGPTLWERGKRKLAKLISPEKL